jgi:hypothetical protein
LLLLQDLVAVSSDHGLRQTNVMYLVKNHGMDGRFSIKTSGFRSGNARRHSWIMIKVAGAVAEECWDGKTFETSKMEWANMMSESDCQGVCLFENPDQPAIEAAKEVFGLLKKRDGPLWPQLVEEARKLIVKSRRLAVLPALAASPR